jgi:hypothetical protein
MKPAEQINDILGFGANRLFNLRSPPASDRVTDSSMTWAGNPKG